jgi:hypothetical protein
MTASTADRSMLLQIPFDINTLGGLVYQATSNQYAAEVWVQIKIKCQCIQSLCAKAASVPALQAFQPSELQDLFKPFISDVTPNFESMRSHLSPSHFMRKIEDVYVEAQAVLLLKTKEEQQKGIECITEKVKGFETFALTRQASAESIAEVKNEVRKKLIELPNLILQTARLIPKTKDSKHKQPWHEIGVNVQEIMGVALFLHASSTQLTFKTSAIDEIQLSTAADFDSQMVPESSFVLIVLQDAWQTAKELLTLNPPKQRSALSRVYSRMDRVSMAIQPMFNHAMAMRRALELKTATMRDTGLKRQRDDEKDAVLSKKAKPDAPPPSPANLLQRDEVALVERCYAFLKQTGIWRVGQTHDQVPCMSNTLLESVLTVVMVRMRVTCARMYPEERCELVNHGVAELFPDEKPESVAMVTSEMWAKFDGEVNAMCMRLM